MIQDPTLWIGEVPEHWELLKGKELFVQVKRGVRDDDGTVTAFRDGVVTLRSNRRTTGFTEAVQFSGYQGVEPGDLVIHQMDGFAGAIGVSDSRGRCSPVCAVSVPRGTANTYFYARVLRAMAVSGWIAALAKGIRERSTDFRFSVFREQVLPVPPEEEQALIVRYLDHAELRIAKAIASKSELLRLLDEQRFSVVVEEVLGRSQEGAAVRGGSGSSEDRVLDWIGAVPGSWSLRQIAEVVSPVYCSNVGLSETQVLSLSYGRVVVKPEEKLRGLVPESFETYQIVNPGDIIIRPTDLQNDRTSLRVGQVEDRGIITSAYMALRPHPAENAKYVMLQLAAYDFMKVFYGYGAGLRQNLDYKHIKHVPMVIPSRREQDEIVRQVEIRTSSLLQARSALLSEIALLKEYRTRLISDVVTGKIDVREEAAKLPDIDPAELAAVLAGGAAGADEEEVADGDD